MSRATVVILGVLLAGSTTAVAGPAPTLPASCVDDGTPYDLDRLRATVTALADPALDGRAPGTAGDLAARTIIADRFRCLGLVPAGADGSYDQPFSADGAATANLVGYVPGTDPAVGGEIIVIGAHHDHLGAGHLGANDNASGVAALLAIAQAVRQHAAPRRTIAFVTFGGEEGGLLGSQHYAANPPADLPIDHVVEFINLDMVGSHASKHAVYAFGAFTKLATSRILTRLSRAYPRLRVGIGGHSVRGDQVPFCDLGIPYVFFWTPDARCYHERCDTAAKLDYPRMVDIAALAGGLVQELADGKADLAAARAKWRCGAR